VLLLVTAAVATPVPLLLVLGVATIPRVLAVVALTIVAVSVWAGCEANRPR
jgi:hypothetical protein